MKKYDVIIVGAGIGGLHLVDLLKETDLKILLVERRSTVKKLQNWIYGTSLEYVQKWNLEEFLVVKKCGFGWYTRNCEYFRDMQKPFCVIDMNPWASSREINCDVETGSEIINIRRENGGITVIDSNENEYHAKIVVDCSGDSQIIGTLLGIRKSRCDFTDISATFENAHIEHLNEMSYY